jgi:hypothetical protein
MTRQHAPYRVKVERHACITCGVGILWTVEGPHGDAGGTSYELESDAQEEANALNRRWWTDCFVVVEVDGMLIGFDGATTTGDDSPSDKGWKFDPSSICEVQAREVTTTVYDRVA